MQLAETSAPEESTASLVISALSLVENSFG
jgi:hypothetical protein